MIDDYLEKLKEELGRSGADPALIQDAVYDAQEYLQNETAKMENQDSEAAFARAVEGYGTPREVASSYIEAELTVTQALRLPASAKRKSIAGRFFGVLADPQAYGALFYMFLSLPIGIAYFTIAVTGISLSLGMAIMIFGLPVMLLFLSIVRGVSFIEGRIVEALLGVRMPRRPRVVAPEGMVIDRIKWWLTDRRTWTTLLYMLLKLPLGIAYFTALVTSFAVSFAVMAMPAIQVIFDIPIAQSYKYNYWIEPWAMPFLVVLGALLFVAFMHLARGLGKLHGAGAKMMLVGRIEEGKSAL